MLLDFYYEMLSFSVISLLVFPSQSQIKLSHFFFRIFPFWGFIFENMIFFSIRKGDYFVSRVSSDDSKIINLCNDPLSSVYSYPYEDYWWGCFYPWESVLHHCSCFPPTRESNLMRNTKWRNPFAFVQQRYSHIWRNFTCPWFTFAFTIQ